MNSAQQNVADRDPRPQPHTAKHLASWYAPGWSDSIGDRLLMFDNTSAPSLELLRFKAQLASAPGFEMALRQRVELLRRFSHPSFSEIRAVESLDGGTSLALVSNHVPGKRLSEILREAKGPSFAIALIRQLTPALVLLQQQGDGVAHGALAADRIVVTPEGRLVIVEHVLGPALERLNFTAGRLWADLRIAVPPVGKSQTPRLDGRTDVVQLAVTALTLLLGRPLRPDETPDRFPALLDQIEQTFGHASPSVAFLRNWLGRALQIDGRLFGSAVDAQEALKDLPDERGQSWRDFSKMLAAPRESFDKPGETATDHARARLEPVILRHPSAEDAMAPAPLPEPPDPPPAWVDEPRPVPHDNGPLPWATRTPPPEPVLFGDEREMVRPLATSKGSARTDPVLRPPFAELKYSSSAPAALRDSGGAQRSLGIVTTTRAAAREHARKRAPVWITAALAFLAVGEAAVIAGLIYVRAPFGSAAITIESVQPGSDVIVDGRSVGVTPLTLTVDSTTKLVRLAAPASAAVATRSRPGARAADPPPATRVGVAPPAVRTGGLRLSSPIDLDVLENGRLLGSTAGPITMAPGSHQLELVNTTLGYRTREAVVVKTGQTTPLAVSVPNGRLSINALPWAEVWIDDKLVGETPLGNVSLPIGAHQIVFRHPQLGERRQSAVVRADAVSRVSVNLQQ